MSPSREPTRTRHVVARCRRHRGPNGVLVGGGPPRGHLGGDGRALRAGRELEQVRTIQLQCGPCRVRGEQFVVAVEMSDEQTFGRRVVRRGAVAQQTNALRRR